MIDGRREAGDTVSCALQFPYCLIYAPPYDCCRVPKIDDLQACQSAIFDARPLHTIKYKSGKPLPPPFASLS